VVGGPTALERLTAGVPKALAASRHAIAHSTPTFWHISFKNDAAALRHFICADFIVFPLRFEEFRAGVLAAVLTGLLSLEADSFERRRTGTMG
jgi:hypothetical protein